MEKDDLFFISQAKDFDIDKLERYLTLLYLSYYYFQVTAIINKLKLRYFYI